VVESFEGVAIWLLTELIEAADRLGQPDRALRAFERVEQTTRAAGRDELSGASTVEYHLR
jgi:hypothetical protein